MRRAILAVFVVTILLTVNTALAQDSNTSSVPNLIRFSGTLRVETSSAVPTVEGLTFAIYKQQDGGAPLWLETENVAVDASGRYSALLGSNSRGGVPAELFTVNEERWLGVQVIGQPEQARVLMVSVPYAFKAHEAETLGGLPAAAYALSPNYSTQSSVAGATQLGTQSTSSVPASKPVSIGILGTGLPNYIPLWITTGTQAWSAMYQDPNTKNIGVGTKTPVTAFDVNGGINALTNYQIGGRTYLSGLGQGNLFVGDVAGVGNTSGTFNTFAGSGAGGSNTTGSTNTFLGASAGQFNVSGINNTFVGGGAGYNSTGSYNSFFGLYAGVSNGTGSNNTFSGYLAGNNNTTGNANTAVGAGALFYNTTGSANTALGDGAGPDQNSPNLVNATAIGANALVSESNALVLGGTGANAVNVGIGTVAPIATLEVVGNAKITGTGHGLFFADGTEQTTAAYGNGGVTSWNGRTGAVVPQSGDYGFTQIGGTLGGSQLSGTYNQAVALSNSSNIFYGDGSHLTGITVNTVAGCISEVGQPPGCPCNGKIEQCIGISNGGSCTVTSQTGSCSASAPNMSYGSCTVCRPN